MSSGILVSSESDAGTYELLTKGRNLAKQLDLEILALIVGKRSDKEIQSYFEYGAQRVLAIPSIDSAGLDAETYAYALSEIAKENGPDIVLITSTKLGKETAGRAAQRLQAGCITDGIGIETKGSDLVVDRYALGGNTISSQIVKTKKKVISIMPRTFEAQPEPMTGKVETIDLKIPPKRVEVIERRKKVGEAVSIESAENLVCIGQGISKKEDLGMVNELCAALNAELGCTRALSSDYHWISEDRMVGISGKRCKPKLHVSIGVSGQIQHTVGIMTSKLIVAINKDREAPIYKIADYGIVGDLYQVVPKLTEKIKSSSR
jgi:electron transfer flavoprotein alpha subunit